MYGCITNKNNQSSTIKSATDKDDVVKLSIVQKLKENAHSTIQEKIALFHTLKKRSPEVYNFENEDELTMFGYSLLWENNVVDALEIFKLIVSEFGTANSYDSLAEAYLKNGDKELSLVNYKKSLELNPENFNAEDQIELIKNPDKIAEKPSELFVKTFTPEQYKSDLDQMGQTLISTHPNALKFISRDAFLKIIREKQKLITKNTTYSQFLWYCSEIISSVNCSHTSMASFYPECVMLPDSLVFPLQIRRINKKIYVTDPNNNKNTITLKDEILSINGIPVEDVIQEIYKHVPSQGYIETTKDQYFNTWATCMIPYAMGFPKKYQVMIKGIKNPIELNKAENFRAQFNDPYSKSCADNLCLEILNDRNSAVLTVASFNYYPWSNLTEFTTFIDSSFKVIIDKKIEHLIIDLRYNYGGSQQSSIHLLKYLLDKPFVYYSNVKFEGKKGKVDGEESISPFDYRYKGKLYFLIDGLGNSTTGHFMSLVKIHQTGTIIGEELGSNQFCSGGQKICRLTNTKLLYYVANNTHETTATSLPDEIGILPDYFVYQNMDEFLSKKDAVKAFAINLILKDKGK
jgi:tetratricopeptide (TPR) repeat protein